MPSTEEREAQPVMGESCPKCGSDVVLRNWQGKFFAKCRRTGCTFGYDTDNRGNPVARCTACGTGRLHLSSAGRVCADCGATEAPASTKPEATQRTRPLPQVPEGNPGGAIGRLRHLRLLLGSLWTELLQR